ncbi:MAG: 3'-5' exonuclease [Bacteroidota bacterium]
MRYLYLLVFFVLFIFACERNSENSHRLDLAPPIPLNLLESDKIPPSPDKDPSAWLLAHIDVETTGLLPGYHEMIDIGLVYTDLEGTIIDSLFLRIQPEFPSRTSPIARQINAYDSLKWEELNALDPESAVEELLSFHRKVGKDKSSLMVSFNSHFDLSFLDQLFRSANHSWREMFHYFVLDIPSMAWSMGYRDLTLDNFLAERNIEDEPHIAHLHTGISGALVNVRIYQELIRKQKEVNP